MEHHTTDEMKALRALAMLEAELTSGRGNKDRLEPFVPLLFESLRSFTSTAFTQQQLSQAISKDHGFAIPSSVLATLLRRMTKQGHLIRSNNTYCLGKAPIPYVSTSADKDNLSKRQDDLICKLLEQANTLNLDYSKAQVVHELYDYLCLNFRRLGNLRGEELDDIPRAQRWIHRFVLQAQKSDPEAFDTVFALVKGLAVYDYVFYSEFKGSNPSFKRLTIFIDSPILCNALGMGTPEEERYAKECFAFLIESGVSCQVLESTVNEIKGILFALQHDWTGSIHQRGANSYAYKMRQRGYQEVDAFELEGLLEDKLETELRLRIAPTLRRKENYTLDERKLEGRLADKDDMGISPRVRHDVSAVANVLTARKGITPKSIEDAVAIFVTSSSHTIRSINSWWRHDEQRSDLPPIIHIDDLTNYVWLSSGKAHELDMHQKQSLVATCASSLAPSDKVWKAFESRIDKWVEDGSMTKEKATALLCSSNLSTCLADYETNNEYKPVKCFDFEQVISSTQKALAEEHFAQDRAVLENEKRHLAIENKCMSESLQRLQERERNSQKMIKTVTRSLDEYKQRSAERNEKIEKMVLWVFRGIWTTLIIVAFFAFEQNEAMLSRFINLDEKPTGADILTAAPSIALMASWLFRAPSILAKKCSSILIEKLTVFDCPSIEDDESVVAI